MTTDIAAAEAAAAEAEHQAAEAERRAVLDEGEPDIGALIEKREAARVAAARVGAARDRAAKAEKAARLQALEDLGRAVDELATTADQAVALTEALEQIANGREAFLSAASEHDQRVAALHKRAAELGSETGQYGPQASSAYVLRARDGGIQHRLVSIAQIGKDRAARGIELAAGGDLAAAIAHTAVVTRHPDRSKQVHRYEVLGTGETFEQTGNPDRATMRHLIDMTIREVETKP